LNTPKIIDKNLSANTNAERHVQCQWHGEQFFIHAPTIQRYGALDFTWRDDPRKNYPGSTWYETQQAELDEVVLKQEIDCDFRASLEGYHSARLGDAAGDIDKFLGIDCQARVTWSA